MLFAHTRKRWNDTKVSQPSDKRTFLCPRRRRIFLHKSFLAEQRCPRLETALRCFRTLEKNWTHQRTEWIHHGKEHRDDLLETELDSLHQNLANGNCPWMRVAGNSYEYKVWKMDSQRQSVFFSFFFFSFSPFSASLQTFCLTVRENFKRENTHWLAVYFDILINKHFWWRKFSVA